MRLISVVMGEDTSANRSTDTVNLLNYGFNSYKLNKIVTTDDNVGKMKVNRGKQENVNLQVTQDVTELLKVNEKSKKYTFETKITNHNAPLKIGDKVGILYIKDQNKVIKIVDLTVLENVEKANLGNLYLRNLKLALAGN